MVNKWTPGPWWVAGTGTIRFGDPKTNQSGWVGRVHWRNRGPNARLIAASPDLYEALAAVEAALRKDSRGQTIVGDGVEYHLDGQTMYHAINKAREALAKASDGGA